MKNRFLSVAASFTLIPLLATSAAEPQVTGGAGVNGGLCVVVPATDGKTLSEYSLEGRFVVQGLSDSGELDAVRAAIPIPLGGLVSVRPWAPSASLPFADNLVDLLVVDRDALKGGGPGDPELLRCVPPVTGALWLRSGGAWKQLTKPMPPEYGEWTHYYCDATNNPVSKDRAVRVPTGMQWIAESPARIGTQNQLIGGGRYLGVFSEAQKVWFSSRNAFNGIQSWRTEPREEKANDRRFGPVVLADGLIYTTEPAKPMTVIARDLYSGKTVKTYDLPLPPNDKPVDLKSRAGGRYLGLAVCEDVLLAWAVDKLFCVDRVKGMVRWTFDGQGKNVDFPSYDPVNHRIG
ncbi:MAG: hypothetical protein H7X95_11975, partial [Deltaproteobacteria bacterium]|nr:hypothetical protein [Deltaproteobacteria bacterium]